MLHGHARISPTLAVRLEEAGVGTARAWLTMQSAPDLAAERVTGSPKVRRPSDVACLPRIGRWSWRTRPSPARHGCFDVSQPC